MDLIIFALSALCVVFLLVALAIPFSDLTRLPLAVVIAVAGLVYGTVSTVVGISSVGFALADYDRWLFETLAFNNQTLLLVFLPPLLFEMALHVNVRRLLEDVSVVAVMAVIAVILATAIVGVLLWLVSPIGLIACLLLGAAVSTTDPAAVISIFKQIGAPRRLLVILEGESLLNDAAAIALFTLLVAALGQSEPIGPGSFVVSFLYGFGAGAACGVAVGWLASRLYGILGGSDVAETTVTVALAYGSYLLSEYGLQASGVVAVVFAGLATTMFGTLTMGPRNWRTLTRVWGQIGFWANTLILLLAATMAPRMLLSLDWWGGLLLVVVYLAAALARAAVLFGLLPGLSRLGISTPITTGQKTLVLWGGVRGAVTLVLALSLSETTGLDPDDAQIIAALGAGYVFMTLLVNASTLAYVTRRLGLDRLSAGDLALRERIVAGAQAEAQAYVTELASERAIDVSAIEAMNASYEPQIREAVTHAEAVAIPFGDRLRLGLTILTSQELRLVQTAFEDGAVGPRSTRVLRGNAERLSDAVRLGGREAYEDMVEANLRFPVLFRVAVWLHRLRLADRLLRVMLERRMTMLLESETVVRDLATFAREVIGPMIGEDATRNVVEFVGKRLEMLHDEIDVIRLQYPGYTRAMESILLMRAGVRRERTQYRRLFDEGIIGNDLHRSLERELDQRMRALATPPPVDLGLTPTDLIGKVPLFAALDGRQAAAIERCLRGRLALPDEVIAAAGERGNAMYFIASGVLEVTGLEHEILLSNGQFFGELALIAPTRRRSTEIVARSFCRLLILSRRDFKRLAKNDPALERTIRDAADRQLGEGFRKSVPEELDWSGGGSDKPEAT
ncbi:cation:proton antiporter [Thalassobaculum sp.]|uniref:cation:proton antiporter n=1 Tax=Thalassobaculum sp. TaxID=2022740 RepID=UPI0032EBA02D